jgi:hypothetical protein
MIKGETMKNNQLYEDVKNKDADDKEEIVGECPKCSYPLVDEMGITLCYHCGFSNDPLI